jgi:hypothetical protein
VFTRGLKQIPCGFSDASALVFDLDHKPPPLCVHTKDHRAAGSCVLEGIVQHVQDGRRQDCGSA